MSFFLNGEGNGYLPLDWLLLTVLWTSALLNGYLGVWRVNVDSGLSLIGRRMIAIGLCGLAGDITSLAWQHGGDLPLAPVLIVFLLLMAGGSIACGLRRIQTGRHARKLLKD